MNGRSLSGRFAYKAGCIPLLDNEKLNKAE